MNKQDKIYIAGHNGMVGSAIYRKIKSQDYTNILVKSSKELDLRNQQQVNEFFQLERPDYVFLAAAKVGGILANNMYKAEFIFDNLAIQNNIIDAAHQFGVKKLLFLGSSCIYPKFANQPILEKYLLTGELESTNEPYAIAKIAGLKMCQFYNQQYGSNFISLMPSNLYGPNDNFDLENSHVLPALLRKFHEAKINKNSSVILWGTGKPLREFLYVDDLSLAIKKIIEERPENPLINIGSGEEITISKLAYMIKEVIGYQGELKFDKSMPDGNPRKLLNSEIIKNLGWSPKHKLKEGLNLTYEWYLDNN